MEMVTALPRISRLLLTKHSHKHQQLTPLSGPGSVLCVCNCVMKINDKINNPVSPSCYTLL